MEVSTLKIDKDYIIRTRRQLHQIPEVGFDLPKTLAYIRTQLDEIGIPYTEKYGKSSIVATLNEGVGNKTIALRADIDALPVQEETGLAFASLHPGKMHACGHDCHAAMLLGTAKYLKEIERDITCCVKFIFQAAEEGPGGAEPMCNDGVMDDVDMIIGCHIYPDLQSGTIAMNPICQQAGSHGFKIFLTGKSCHVARPNEGVDAIAMGVRVFNELQFLRSRELDQTQPVVIGIGEFHGGSANNIVCDQVMLHGTIRTINQQMDERIYQRICQIAENTARDMGGSATVETTKYYPPLCNNPMVAEAVNKAAEKIVSKDNIRQKPLSMGAEDFAFYTLHKPGAMFGLGVKPEDGNFAPLHNGKMLVNEDVLDITPKLFIRFILDQMES